MTGLLLWEYDRACMKSRRKPEVSRRAGEMNEARTCVEGSIISSLLSAVSPGRLRPDMPAANLGVATVDNIVSDTVNSELVEGPTTAGMRVQLARGATRTRVSSRYTWCTVLAGPWRTLCIWLKHAVRTRSRRARPDAHTFVGGTPRTRSLAA